ncbi:MAG: (2Fe-2S)-binding protein, partial [Veillonella parvula]|nr:(2Fe-2S)-binding protein [Veillonella parvula]
KEVTRAGTGACGGKGCGPRIVKLLAEMKEQGKI